MFLVLKRSLLLGAEPLGLFGNQFFVLKVVDLHCPAHIVHSLGGGFAGFFASFFEEDLDLKDLLKPSILQMQLHEELPSLVLPSEYEYSGSGK